MFVACQLLSALIQLVAYGPVFNLDKKTLAKMEADLGRQHEDMKADITRMVGGDD